jgi:hypothetical protein
MADTKLYANAHARFDTVVGENQYFAFLRKIREEFDLRTPYDSYAYEFDQGDFERYVLENYGIRITFDVTYSAITADYTVVNEQKYLIAVLKFA